MNDTRLQQVAKPLDSALRRYGFELQEEPLEGNSVRMAAYVDQQGRKIDYSLEIRKDVERGQFTADSEIKLSLRLYQEQGPVELFPWQCSGSNAPILEMVKDLVQEHIEPNLRKHLQPAHAPSGPAPPKS